MGSATAVAYNFYTGSAGTSFFTTDTAPLDADVTNGNAATAVNVAALDDTASGSTGFKFVSPGWILDVGTSFTTGGNYHDE